jgi:hypothetical protein
MSDTEVDVDELLDWAAAYTREIQEAIEQDDVETALERLEELLVLADEGEDILSRVDLAELAETIDWSNLPEAVDLSEVPEAVRTGDVSEAVALRELLSLSDLPDLWDSVDVREVWREYREFDDAADDLGDESDSEDDSLHGRSDVAEFDRSRGLAEFDPETVENAVQYGVNEAVEEFRESLFAARERLASLKEANRRRTSSYRSGSRNPTDGYSTMPPKGSPGGSTRHSTVPEETRYSGAPNRRRIYGSRFEEAVGDE